MVSSLGYIYKLTSEAAAEVVLYNKGVLRNFTEFTGKHLCQSLFLTKLQDLQSTASVTCEVFLFNLINYKHSTHCSLIMFVTFNMYLQVKLSEPNTLQYQIQTK